MRILVDENIPQGDAAFAAYGEVERFHGRKLTRRDLLDRPDAEALIVRSITRVDSALLEGTAVRFVGTATIGTDHVDLAYLARAGIGFASAPGCNANSVGEYVTAALLELEASAGLRLQGATLGLVGYGHVGRRVKPKAEALGLRVLLCDPPLQERGLGAELGVAFSSFTTLLAESDVLSLHVPLTRQGPHATLNLLGSSSLPALVTRGPGRPLAVFNTCRGEVIEAAALIEAKARGLIHLAVLDVFPGEPRPEPGLWRACEFVTPHIAGYSLQGKLGGTQQVLAAFCSHFGLGAPVPVPEPAPSHPVIDLGALPRGLGREALLRHAVRHAYDLRADDRRLREALVGEDPGAGFDALRRDYPIRHEFTRYCVAGLESVGRDVSEALKRLGFGVV